MAREPHYADMMETWSTIVTVLYFYLIVVMGVTDFVTANAGSLMLCLITSAFMRCSYRKVQNTLGVLVYPSPHHQLLRAFSCPRFVL